MPRPHWDDLPAIQQDLLQAIAAHVQVHGYAPSYQFLADTVGAARSTVATHLASLVRDGFLTRGAPRTPRAISLAVEVPS